MQYLGIGKLPRLLPQALEQMRPTSLTGVAQSKRPRVAAGVAGVKRNAARWATNRSGCDACMQDNDQPFFVVDVGDIVYKVKLWKLKIPRVEPFYAVKCNGDPVVLELLAGLGLGFDCASKAEIDTMRAVGVASNRIIYANPCKTRSYIKHAAALGVDLMTFDNELELHKVRELYPTARLVLRLRVDDTGSVCRLGLKFGCEQADTQHLLNVARSLDLNVVGVSFHVGSNSHEPQSFARAIEGARQVFDQGLAMGFPMTLLDIGGGYPGDRGFQKLFDQIAYTINTSLAEHFPEESGVRIIAEPGRFFVSSAFTLYTTVIAKREAGGRPMYYLNDGVYGSFNCTVFDHAEPVPFALHSGDGPLRLCSLWGPTCDSMDMVLEDALLPEMQPGDWIVFENMGAYTICAASNFNGFQVPEVKYMLTYSTIAYLRELPFWEKLVCHLGGALQQPQPDTCGTSGQGAGAAQVPPPLAEARG